MISRRNRAACCASVSLFINGLRDKAVAHFIEGKVAVSDRENQQPGSLDDIGAWQN